MGLVLFVAVTGDDYFTPSYQIVKIAKTDLPVLF